MPELPEVETVRLGLVPKLEGNIVSGVILRRSALRWPIPPEIVQLLLGKQILRVRRLAKYLLIDLVGGSLIIHLGMSGRLQIVASDTIVGKHDHVDIVLTSGSILRYTDPRRFGCILWQPSGETHTLLSNLGVEPLSCSFDSEYLFESSRKRMVSIKAFLMDQHIIVGIGNIYAAETLFMAGIAPHLKTSQLTYSSCVQLVKAIKNILSSAIICGGTTFRDFVREDGQPGYFEQKLAVYGRSGKPCIKCGAILSNVRISNRSTVWCSFCQH